MRNLLSGVADLAVLLFAVTSMLSVRLAYPAKHILGPMRDVSASLRALLANFVLVPLLANERTFLAWIRTALALVVTGVALEALGEPPQPGLRLTASALLFVLGFAVPVWAWHTWAKLERALRSGAPLPASSVALPVVFVVGIAAAAVLVMRGLLTW